MRLLCRLLHKNCGLAIGTMVILSAANIVFIIWNTYVSKIVDLICEKESVPVNIIQMTILFLSLCMCGNYLRTWISGWTGETINHNLRMGFARHLMNRPLQESEELSVGGQMSLLQNEITEISTYISNNLFDLVNTVIAFLLTIIFLWYQSPALTIANNLPVVLILLYVTVSSKVIAGYARTSQECKQRMNGAVESMTGAVPVLHLYDCGGYLCEKYNQLVEQWQEAYVKEEKVRSRLMSLSGLLSCIPLLTLLCFGGSMVIHGQLRIGVVYIFINLSKNVSGPLMNLPGFIASYRRFLVNLNRVENQIELGEGN